MQKVRIREIAQELGITNKEVLEKAQTLGIDAKNHLSSISADEADKIMRYVMSGEHIVTHPTQIDVATPAVVIQSETISEDVKKEEVEETIIVETPKEIQKETPIEKKESLADATFKKRGGITVVSTTLKKKDSGNKPTPQVEEIKVKEEVKIQEETPIKEDKNLTETDLNLLKKRKKIKKSMPAPKKSAIQKIELLEDRDLNRDIEDIDESEDEVILPDFSEEVVIKKEEKKVIDSNKIRSAKIKSFIEQQQVSKSSKKRRRRQPREPQAIGKIYVPEDIRLYEFAEKIDKPMTEVIKVLFDLGVMITKNDFLDKDSIDILAEHFDLQITTNNSLDELDYVAEYDEIEDDDNELSERPPVVTIMGHVDHGKTSLLDKIRNTKVALGEAGGITQHIGAYQVEKNGKKITFIDTPGHEAFTEMRARGAKVTDIAIIVVSADDGIKPQTIEAINHAKAAEVPIIIAITKIDKPDINIERVKTQMAEQGLTPVEWGGEYEFIPVSAFSGAGIDDLLETILLQAEIMELKANKNKLAKAIVIEGSLEKGLGAVATVIVVDGTLKVGDSLIIDTIYGKVRAINDDMGKRVKSISLSEAGQIVGLSDVPQAGSFAIAIEDDSKAKSYADKRAELKRGKELSKSTKATFEELTNLIAEGSLKALPIIIKADFQGSLEAIKGSLEKIKNSEVKVNIIHSGIGPITENDISLASASTNAIVIGFNVRASGAVSEKAKNGGVQIKTYSIIYDLLEDIKALLSGMMSPVLSEEITGSAEVRDTFVIAKVGTIAGCMVVDGVINRNSRVRVIRDGAIIQSGAGIASLKRFKDDAREVSKGYECGIMIDKFNDIQVGDVIEVFKEVEKKAVV